MALAKLSSVASLAKVYTGTGVAQVDSNLLETWGFTYPEAKKARNRRGTDLYIPLLLRDGGRSIREFKARLDYSEY